MDTKPKILIAEDDPDLMDIAKIQLEQDGFEVLSAGDGGDALTIAREQSPDFIILDILMPNIDGLTALQELKKDPRTKEIPTIILSNLGDQASKEQAKNITDVEYFVKSKVSIDEIIEVIRRKLKIPI
ncbi:MAG: two-component system response regulator [Candidatus Buchananbacteria bacterium CG10_big_fil_rev_8_21_14_0_10_42_9]|uniref:Two-component system response regulator n=1 Tax=Candidatus Buchananbacteria bacterium CG10_big_fil_rev_8_21_14_0_10_42_9 TaxID=1974526 RepID=A0A2H0VZV5_9BACT|nr:MAG: two-component system response regulator [Candidatus Buchananbacteria bacterium CG10_big_fil_rev_8_21_14_0_10_42_9]